MTCADRVDINDRSQVISNYHPMKKSERCSILRTLKIGEKNVFFPKKSGVGAYYGDAYMYIC